MRKLAGLLAGSLAASALMLISCGKKTPVPDGDSRGTVPEVTELQAETTVTSVTETDASGSVTAQTGSSRTSQQTAGSSPVTASGLPSDGGNAPCFTTAVTAQPPELGGHGGEAHGNDPDPLFFVYRFLPDSVSMRLAGGTYQRLLYDFSGVIAEDGTVPYRLEDLNADGSPDLLAASAVREMQTDYACFLWDSTAQKYREAPILLSDPTAHPDDGTVTELKAGLDPPTLTVYEWTEGSLKPLRRYTADYDALTLYETDLQEEGSEQTEAFSDSDALTAALLAHQ